MKCRMVTYSLPWYPDAGDTVELFHKLDNSIHGKSWEYIPAIHYLNFPKSKYPDAQSVLDECEKTQNWAKRSIIMGMMNDEIRSNPEEMAKIIGVYPSAIVHADKSILTPDFVKPFLLESPGIYSLLPRHVQKSPEIIDAYAEGILNSGANYVKVYEYGSFKQAYEREEPILELPVQKYAIDKHCDLKQFYSPDNYRKAYEKLLTDGDSRNIYPTPGYRDMDPWQRYQSPLAFMAHAHEHAKKDDLTTAKYEMAAAEAIVNCIDTIIHRVSTSYSLQINNLWVQLMAKALETFEHPPEILGIGPRQDMIDLLKEKTQEAERMFYADKGQELKKEIASSPANYPETASCRYGIERLDRLMELSETHPEMGIDDEMRSQWWRSRGVCLETMEQDHQRSLDRNGGTWSAFSEEVHYLRKLAANHEEMRIGEQLTIEGFEFTDRDNR